MVLDGQIYLEMVKNNIEFIIQDWPEPEVPSAFQNVQVSQADIYYKFRYTFNDEDSDLESQCAVTRMIIRELKRFMLDGKFIAGIEYFKTGMTEARPHVHIHFVSRTKKDTIRKWLKRHDEKEAYADRLFKGNRCYSMGVEVNVNLEKFWRYPLKQQKNDTHKAVLSNGFDKVQLMELVNSAYAVWITSCEVQNKKTEKKENNDLFADRLFNYLDGLGTTSEIGIKIGIQKFYIVEENKPFNKTTAQGYLINYKIKKGILDHHNLANMW